jgi:hypothetical protein
MEFVFFKLIVSILLCYGISNIVVYGSGPANVFEKFRTLMFNIHPNLGEWSSCMMCMPATVGIVMSLLDWFLFTSITILPFNLLLAGTSFWYFAALMDGCLLSGTTWILHQIEEWLERGNPQMD